MFHSNSNFTIHGLAVCGSCSVRNRIRLIMMRSRSFARYRVAAKPAHGDCTPRVRTPKPETAYFLPVMPGTDGTGMTCSDRFSCFPERQHIAAAPTDSRFPQPTGQSDTGYKVSHTGTLSPGAAVPYWHAPQTRKQILLRLPVFSNSGAGFDYLII